MEFFNTAYIYLAPLLLLASFFINKKYKYYCLNILAVVNILLIFNSIFIIRQLYAFVQMALQMNVKPNPNVKVEIGWQEIKMWLTILVPFLFLIKPISSNKILTLFMLFLLLNTWLIYVWNCLKGSSKFYCSEFTTYHLSFQLMHYLSWIITVYALFWLIKYLPYSSKKIAKLNSK